MHKKIADLISSIGKAYQIIPKDYPFVGSLPQEYILNFSLSHSLKHMVKKVGRLARKEVAPQSGDDIEKALYSLLISSFKMAELLKINEQKISKAIILTTNGEYKLQLMQLLVDMSYLADLLEEADHGTPLAEAEIEKARLYVINCIDDICALARSKGITMKVFFSEAHLHI